MGIAALVRQILIAKRLQDLGRSGWRYLWMILVPGLLASTISARWGSAVDFSVGPNRFGYPG